MFVEQFFFCISGYLSLRWKIAVEDQYVKIFLQIM